MLYNVYINIKRTEHTQKQKFKTNGGAYLKQHGAANRIEVHGI